MTIVWAAMGDYVGVCGLLLSAAVLMSVVTLQLRAMWLSLDYAANQGQA